MTGENWEARAAVVRDRIIRNIHGAKTFAKVVTTCDTMLVDVEVRCKSITTCDTEFIQSAVREVYSDWSNKPERIQELYVILAADYLNSEIRISELDDQGCGTTAIFNQERPSQA